jgi:nitrite reductase/ring-hydroxylating ferredoxin subunit
MTDTVSRRIVFQGLGFLGVAAALAGCGGSSDASDSDASAAASSGTALATTDEVPVGGGIVLTDAGVVLTQPTAGEFKAFTAICTHQGAALDAVTSEGIECPLHGSRFSIEDGSVVRAAAGLTPEEQDPLPEAEIVVNGDQITFP